MVINRLRGKLARIPGATLFLQSVQDIRVGGRGSNAQYQYTLRADNLDDLNEWSQRLLQTHAHACPSIRDANTDQQSKGLQTERRDRPRHRGAAGHLARRLIDDALYDAFGQRNVSTMYMALNQYFVVMEVDPQFQQDPDSLKGIYVLSSTGQEVPLSAFAQLRADEYDARGEPPGPVPGDHALVQSGAGRGAGRRGRARSTRPSARSACRPRVQGSFMGTAQAFQSSLANEPMLILAALVTVYIVLGMLYESFIHPITILSTLPSAGVGALLALLLTHEELSVIALIGIILLIGIVKKNAIMMIDFALDAERREGKNSRDAIYEACLLRFRPIMMTTMAAHARRRAAGASAAARAPSCGVRSASRSSAA